MKRMRTQDFLRQVLPPVVLSLLAGAVLAAWGHWDLVIVTVIIGMAWTMVSLQAVVTKNFLYKINTQVKSTRGSISTIEEKGAYVAARADQVNESIGRNERRLIRMNGTLNDIAGSVGKAAPRIRRIEGATSMLVASGTNGSQVVASKVGSKKAGSGRLATSPVANEITFPPVKPLSATPTYSHVKVAVIADEFTAKAFSYEWETEEPTPENWRSIIDNFEPDFLFVESAWEANGASWRYHLVGVTAPRAAIVELVAYCKEKHIPTVFWNKEDPPHFEDFLPTASLFDYVYTTDGDLIDEYKARLGHDRVAVLPFAAQPKIHNPARVDKLSRNKDIVFGGMYFREKYPERREQLDMILPAAAKFKIDIFSRHDGSDIKYRFPDEYRNFVRGSLPYQQMLTAYHVYKAVINVNSVTKSATMCARRIFEATACGAAVVTEPSEAISNFFPRGMLTEVKNRDQAFHRIRTILRSDEFRERKVHIAQRHLWENHTYTHRAQKVMKDLEIPHLRNSKTVSFFISSNRPSNVEIIFQNVSRQNVENKQLVLLTHGFELADDVRGHFCEKYNLPNIKVLTAPLTDSLGKNLNRLASECSGDFLFRMDDDDYYGENYARDLLHALDYTGADLAGKAATYIHFEEMNSTILTYEGHEHRFTDFIRGASFCGPKSTFAKYKFPELARSEDSAFLTQILDDQGKIYATDRFNFMVMRRSDKSSHTWKVTDENLYSTGVAKFVGGDPEQIEV